MVMALANERERTGRLGMPCAPFRAHTTDVPTTASKIKEKTTVFIPTSTELVQNGQLTSARRKVCRIAGTYHLAPLLGARTGGEVVWRSATDQNVAIDDCRHGEFY